MSSNWIAYNDLAWTEDWFVQPGDYDDEVKEYVDLINKSSSQPPKTLLHLGCGAGGHDAVLKKHFQITGMDLSTGMLEKACKVNPEVEYHEGDMRTIRFDRLFDAVIIPDSIDYMATEEDLHKAMHTAALHLKPGGVFLVVAKTKENFQNNNFAYSGEKDGVHITLLENNYINPFRSNTYEATFVFLIRKQGELTIHNDHHLLGLFPHEVWKSSFIKHSLTFNEKPLLGIYDDNLLNDGEYPMFIFYGTKENAT